MGMNGRQKVQRCNVGPIFVRTAKPNDRNNPIPRFSYPDYRSVAQKEAPAKPKIYSATNKQAVQQKSEE